MNDFQPVFLFVLVGTSPDLPDVRMGQRVRLYVHLCLWGRFGRRFRSEA